MKSKDEMVADLIGKARELGRLTALGKKGTGWMAYSKGELKKQGLTDSENPYEFAEGWFEIEQWQYETADLLGIATKLDSGTDYPEAFVELQDAWAEGYMDGVYEIEAKASKVKAKRKPSIRRMR